MKLVVLGMLALPLGGCWIYERPVERSLTIEPTINAEAECKRLARNLVQIARCSNRR